jgi:UDP-2,3-diacylglucosamine pyrophosphatase LpxH
MKYIYCLIILGLTFALFSCSDNNSNNSLAEVPPLKIAVFTDNHYYDASLGNGSAFEYYCKTENKLVAESQALNTALIDNILSENCDIVLVPGDLTLNGEKFNHLKMQAFLTKIEDSGKRVFVIPGNHDINSPYSYKFEGTAKTAIENINKIDFVNIYNNFGYNEAYSRDANSLSYATYLAPNTILLALDGSKYEQYTSSTLSSGIIKSTTITWMQQILHEAKSNNKKVIVMMHYSLIEHFTGQSANPGTDEYILDNGAEVSRLLADSSVAVIFTGHFHANDISQFKSPSGNIIYDIETGSVLTYPHSYRIINLFNSKINIETKNITNVKYNNIADFNSYSQEKTKSLLVNYFNAYWGQFTEKFPGNYSEETKALIKNSFVSAVFAHYVGDEEINSETSKSIKTLSESGNLGLNLIAFMLNSIYTDLEPKDRNVELLINK